MEPPRFAVDKMLGRLATWLRLLGIDAAYGPHLSGRTLLRVARRECRIVLTRDTHLARAAAGVPLLFVVGDRFRDQLHQVLTTFHIDPFPTMLTRCSRCNEPLEELPRERAAPFVPAYVRETAERFVQCPRCRRIYWPGTHAERMRKEMAALGIARGNRS